ncbi:MAG: DUF6612 family protein [Erysipelotrichaceae bacterium]|nr:DUF6612 family protein [Erysipelotrichaceae bacterium]
MKKILIVVFVLLLGLFGCTKTQTKEELLAEYQSITEQSAAMTSYAMNMEMNIAMTIGEDSYNSTVETNMVVQDLGTETAKLYMSANTSTEGTDVTLESYFVDGVAYMDINGTRYYQEMTNDDYLSMTGTYSSAFLQESSYIDTITKTKEGNLTVYTIVLNTDGLMEVYNDMIGELDYDTLGIDVTYDHAAISLKVNKDNYIESMTIDTAFQMSTSDDYVIDCAFTGSAGFTDYNSAVVTLPDDLDTYTAYTTAAETSEIQTMDDFAQWLVTDYGFEEIETNIFRQEYADGQYYYFDLNNYIYSYENSSAKYDYYFNDNIGMVGTCVYDFNTETGTNCTDDEISNLQYTQQAMAYDLEQAGLY